MGQGWHIRGEEGQKECSVWRNEGDGQTEVIEVGDNSLLIEWIKGALQKVKEIICPNLRTNLKLKQQRKNCNQGKRRKWTRSFMFD